MAVARLRRAFDVSARSAPGIDRKVDAALIAAGRTLADQIDAAVVSGGGTKALYLVPHLVSVLREMGATPAARVKVSRSAAVAAPPKTAGAADEVAALRDARSWRAG